MKKTLERLENLLEERESKIENLERELQELKDESEKDWAWARHRTLKENPDNLPVPRLEIRYKSLSDDGYLAEWHYRLIYKHLLGHLIEVPLGHTGVQGGNGSLPIYKGEIRTPFRDGAHICHDSEQFKVPAFAVCEDFIARLFMKDGKCQQERYEQ